MQKTISFQNLKNSDLFIDAIYEGGKQKNVADDPINKLLKCGNQGGFRYSGSHSNNDYPYIVLYSNFDNYDWPDSIDFQTGLLTYYGDNKSPGHLLHDTSRKGNKILEFSFKLIHEEKFKLVKPFFLFSKASVGRDVIFRGVAVPGGPGVSSLDDLQAIWKFKDNQRFQNYKALFTILDIGQIKREWIDDLEKGKIESNYMPLKYLDFYEKGIYRPLISQRSYPIRKRLEQLPTNSEDKDILDFIYGYFSGVPTDFELFAADIAKLLLKNIVEIDITRPWRDGGRDALGKLRIGSIDAHIVVDFALEAKCYKQNNSVGVREMSRLISRIKYREFGILVTTSHVDSQAYKEVIVDKHPIIILSGRDIVEILKENGFNTKSLIKSWIDRLFNQRVGPDS